MISLLAQSERPDEQSQQDIILVLRYNLLCPRVVWRLARRSPTRRGLRGEENEEQNQIRFKDFVFWPFSKLCHVIYLTSSHGLELMPGLTNCTPLLPLCNV
jgi:hypothetical protein